MSLRKAAINSGKWSAVSTVLVVIFQTLQISIVSRFLDPSSFGLMGMVMVVIGFAQTFSDMGISSAIIQRKDPTKEQLSSLYWLNIMSGSVVFILVLALKPLIAAFYNSPDLDQVLTWTAIMFLIIPFGQQFQILLQKELKFKALAMVQTIAMSAATVMTVALAYLGYGIYALVLGQLINCSVQTVILIVIGCRNWRPKLHFRKQDLKGYLGFGLYQIGEKTVTYFNNNLDTIMIGKLLGAQALGYYIIAYNLIVIPLTKVNPIINRVAFPLFARIQDNNERLRVGYLKVMNVLSFINFPLYFGLCVTAPLLIPALFGAQWSESILITQILCGVGLLRTIANPAGALVLAKGRADLGFIYNFFKTVLQIPVFYLGIRSGGVVGVAFAFLALKVFYFNTNYLVCVRKMLGPCLKKYLASMRFALIASVSMALFVCCSGQLLSGFSNAVSLIIEILLGVVFYAGVAVKFKPEIMSQIKQRLKMKSEIKGGVST